MIDGDGETNTTIQITSDGISQMNSEDVEFDMEQFLRYISYDAKYKMSDIKNGFEKNAKRCLEDVNNKAKQETAILHQRIADELELIVALAYSSNFIDITHQ